MAIIRGGLHGRPSGNVAGVVYGAARTRIGKAVTARELVFPSNPQTAAQMLQRHIFMESLYATRYLGPTVYQDYFNRSIGQLPGFQSMMSILLNGTNAAEEFHAPPDTPLGNLHFPGTCAVTTGGGAVGTYEIDWSTENGLNGTVADTSYIFDIQVIATPTYTRWVVVAGIGPARSVGHYDGIGLAGGTDHVNCIFFVGVGAALGNLSLARWEDFTSHA